MNSLGAKLQQAPSSIVRKVILAISRPRYTSKVFCIGFNKTGTTSCGEAFKLLGYRHSSYNKRLYRQCYKNNKIVKVLQYAAKFDSVDDLPWSKEDMIPILDKVFPDSKFVYLVRDEESWKNSFRRSNIIKGRYPDVEKRLREYRKHREFVMQYFADKPKEQFLVLDVSKEGAFKELADFLGKIAPQEHFPHRNKTGSLPEEL